MFGGNGKARQAMIDRSKRAQTYLHGSARIRTHAPRVSTGGQKRRGAQAEIHVLLSDIDALGSGGGRSGGVSGGGCAISVPAAAANAASGVAAAAAPSSYRLHLIIGPFTAAFATAGQFISLIQSNEAAAVTKARSNVWK
jgi:hypothetical protein